MRHTVADRDARLTGALTTPERRRLTALPTKLVADDGPSAIHGIEHLIAQAHYRLRHLEDHPRLGRWAADLRIRHFVGPGAESPQTADPVRQS
ncbi:hypothetical protein [Streptosporangium sp. NPDC001681]